MRAEASRSLKSVPPTSPAVSRQKGEPYSEVDEKQRARLDEVRRELLG